MPTRPSTFDVVIVGAGHAARRRAGAQTAIALRQRKFAGSIALVGDEPDLTYESPPLSKDYLSGTKASPESYRALPWFWSHQYDIKLQTVSLSAAHDATLVRGDPGARSFSVLYLKNGRVIALDCVNAVRTMSKATP